MNVSEHINWLFPPFWTYRCFLNLIHHSIVPLPRRQTGLQCHSNSDLSNPTSQARHLNLSSWSSCSNRSGHFFALYNYSRYSLFTIVSLHHLLSYQTPSHKMADDSPLSLSAVPPLTPDGDTESPHPFDSPNAARRVPPLRQYHYIPDPDIPRGDNTSLPHQLPVADDTLESITPLRLGSPVMPVPEPGTAARLRNRLAALFRRFLPDSWGRLSGRRRPDDPPRRPG